MNFTAYLFDIERRIKNNMDGRDIGIFYGTTLRK
jgi:tetrahydromethanopterin S-methyltransferase subunit G